jgi:hypothetical protein
VTKKKTYASGSLWLKTKNKALKRDYFFHCSKSAAKIREGGLGWWLPT